MKILKMRNERETHCFLIILRMSFITESEERSKFRTSLLRTFVTNESEKGTKGEILSLVGESLCDIGG